MANNIIHLNEDELKEKISKSIKKVISEGYGMPNYQQQAESKVGQCVNNGANASWAEFAAALDSVANLASSEIGGESPYFKYLKNLSMVALKKAQGERQKTGGFGNMFGGNRAGR